jgi:hypothetical protein
VQNVSPIHKSALTIITGSLMITETARPLNSEELMNTIANNKYSVMFSAPGQPTEKLIRATDGFKQVLQTYPPVYADSVADTVTYVARLSLKDTKGFFAMRIFYS